MSSFPIERIVLAGFMGAGKSTVGPILARSLNWNFIDADRYLEAKTSATIAQLFEQFGESAFRQQEAEAFAELHSRRNVVLALGGGALETPSTREILAAAVDTYTIFLNAPLPVLLDRCSSQSSSAIRPLLRQLDTLEARYLARLPHYQRAHLTVDTSTLTPYEAARQILTAIQSHLAATISSPIETRP